MQKINHTLQGKHVVVEALTKVSNFTRLGKIFKKTSAATFFINHRGFKRGLNGCSIYLKNRVGGGFSKCFFPVCLAVMWTDTCIYRSPWCA